MNHYNFKETLNMDNVLFGTTGGQEIIQCNKNIYMAFIYPTNILHATSKIASLYITNLTAISLVSQCCSLGVRMIFDEKLSCT